MRLTSLLLADHAEAVRGKLYLTGGAWDTIHTRGVPTVHPHVSVVVVLEVGWEDLDRSVQVEVKLLDADGRSLLQRPVGGQARAVRQPGVRPGDTTPLVLVFNLLGVRFEAAGSHTVTVELDGQPSGQVPLKVRLRRPPPTEAPRTDDDGA